MKQTLKLFAVALIGGAATLGGYKMLEDTTPSAPPIEERATNNEKQSFIPTNFNANTTTTNVDFVDAAEKTVNAVVHVKNTSIRNQPTNVFDFFNGGGAPRESVGSGSGVIISPDGHIITNNHVIENASELTVTLNNNKTYAAELVGTDPKTDIALIQIMGDDTDFPYVPFGDSNDIKIGEWVLAVGNPFNLTSTVTAGIVSAKARDLEGDNDTQSYIQTDAAVNRGNSGGALVNTRGELVGINTAITSETGSYVGYSFAVPSNNARKVIEDIMEYGDVQRGILGISTLPIKYAQEKGIDITEGVYIAEIEKGSGADIGGLKEGDIIKQIDNIKITKFADLTGYLGSKRPDDVVEVVVNRDGGTKSMPVTLIKYETFEVIDLGIEVKNATPDLLKNRGLDYGVVMSRPLKRESARYFNGKVITKLDDTPVKNVADVKRVMKNRKYEDPLQVTFVDENNETHNYIFR